MPVFMHPKPPPGYQDDDIAPLVAFPADTTLSTTKLLYKGEDLQWQCVASLRHVVLMEKHDSILL
jgi:hypothetical protein